jgi:putative flavoprotein involved in K+ transport
VRFNSTVTHIARDDDGWSIAVGDEVLRARQVVVATGYDAKPSVPDWPGREEFTGVFMHAAEYRDATPFVGGDVLVVGAGSTASDVATDLVRGGAARVHVSIRTAPNIFPRKFFGTHSQYGALMGEPMPVLADRIGFVVQRLLYGDLQQYGLARPSEGMHVHFRNTGHGPLVDDGFVELVKRGLIEVVPAVAGFDGAEVRLVDGHSIRPRSVLAATGYVRQLEPLVGHLGLLAADGCPAVSGPRTDERAPGLYFVGFVRKMSGQLRPMRAEARQIARAASAALKREHKARRGFGGWRSSGSRLRQSREPSLMAAASTRAPGDADEAAG